MDDQPEHGNPEIDDRAVLLRFFRVGAGAEKKALEHLSKRPSESSIVCKMFGSADFAVMETGKDWSSNDDPLSDDGGNFEALDVMPLRCFSWKGHFDWSTLRVEAQQFVAFAFIKIRETDIAQLGLGAELRIYERAKKLVESHVGVTVHCLSTVGWYEVLLIVTGSALKKIEEFVLDLRSRGEGGEERFPEIDSTTTIVGVRCDATIASGASLEGVELALHVSCRPDADEIVYSDLTKRFPNSDIVWSFGVNDFVVRIREEVDAASYVDRLWDFRNKHQDWIFRTLTLIGGPPDGGPKSAPREPGARVVPKLRFAIPTRADHRIEDLSKQDSALGAMTISAFAMLKNYSQDPSISQAFADLLPYAERLRSALVRGDSVPALDPLHDLNFLGVALDLLSFGIHQRAVGTGVFWEREVATYPYPNRFGGLHRILTSIAAIPTAMLEHCHASPVGFYCRGIHRGLSEVSLGRTQRSLGSDGQIRQLAADSPRGGS